MPESIQYNKSSEKDKSSLRSRHPRAEASITMHTRCSSAISRWRGSPNARCAMVRAKRLEAVPQSLHVGVLVALQLEARGDDLGGPGDAGGGVVGLEHQVEVAGVGGVDGEVVGAVPGVGFGVGGEPCLCGKSVSESPTLKSIFGNHATYLVPPWISSGTSRRHTSRRPSSPWP